MKAEEIKNHFKVYLGEIPRLISTSADWALLHYIIIFPDICGALENPDGLSNKTSYINWANRYIGDTKLTGEEWYDIRCRILHQGITAGRLRYPGYFFKSPGVTDISHKQILPDGSIVLDVHAMKDEILAGLDKWFSDVENNQGNSKNVILNVPSIAGIVTISGANSTTVASIQLSATVSRTASQSYLNFGK